MKALTIDALWAWAIVHGPKRVENRSWRTNYRGPLAIHAGKNRSRDAEALAFLRSHLGPLRVNLPTADELEAMRGKILGVAELVDVVDYSPDDVGPVNELFPRSQQSFLDDPFAFGPQCWMLGNVRSIEPVPAIGKQQLWNVDPEVASRIVATTFAS